MEEQNLQRKLTTILVADVVGFSRLTANDEDWTIRAVGEVRAIVDEIIRGHEGRIFNTGGDSVLAEFASPVEAVRSAVDFQAAVRARNLLNPQDRQIRYRIGINLGDVLVRDGDLLGDGVNVAARLETLAEPGGICISGTVWDHIHGKLTIAYVDMGDQFVKNIPRPVRAFHLRLGDSHAVPADDRGAPAREAIAPAAKPSATPSVRRRRVAPWLALGVVAVAVAAGGWTWRNSLRSAEPSLKEALDARLASAAPGMSEPARFAAVQQYAALPEHKALASPTSGATAAVYPWNTSARPTSDNAREAVLEGCQVNYGTPCVLLVVDNDVQPMPANDAWIAQDMPRTRYRGNFNPAEIPGSWPDLRERSDIAGYASAPDFKAAAYHPGGMSTYVATKAADQRTAELEALKACNEDLRRSRGTGPCFLYAVGNRVVLPLRLQDAMTAAPR
ncbi:MAG: adenylate/guanylate cyclase domain-containing protein [Alphaproteobacteria bacterium]|nr:adenylate/guanylate cyclase domain-containing protein [Alphaproteobacteria bacterium]MBV8411495.1 adenylate/guanylate cyclase domain-containing protein [Alphaproteobacteria bacterium]